MTNHKPISSRKGLELVEKIRKQCSTFPEVTENIDSFGHTSFRVKDKPFVMLGEKDQVFLSIKTDKDTQQFLLQQEDTNYLKTRYIGHHGWVTVRSHERADWKELEELIIEAYFRNAPRKYQSLLKASRE
ncbi:MmcQ/YjbR family DNA-binding protein [Paenibacillus sp. UNC451MF]|uniref:MmcQ/YjbR family DNA-binding protein n=1 Tax=Paenibacillus sp. UNC451MF TaxID=1449063 RepID=UPI00055AABB8|nr:MmcQ/YjbR family DNA-binding protein [Paenibacillus sp. UNC451MF]